MSILRSCQLNAFGRGSIGKRKIENKLPTKTFRHWHTRTQPGMPNWAVALHVYLNMMRDWSRIAEIGQWGTSYPYTHTRHTYSQYSFKFVGASRNNEPLKWLWCANMKMEMERRSANDACSVWHRNPIPIRWFGLASTYDSYGHKTCLHCCATSHLVIYQFIFYFIFISLRFARKCDARMMQTMYVYGGYDVRYV